MKTIRKYSLVIMVLGLLAGLGACKFDPSDLLVAPDGAIIDYTGAQTSLYSGNPATLTVKNDINSNVFRIFLHNSVTADPISDDLLGSFDCIGARRINTIRGVPKLNGDLYVHFADDNTDSVIFTGCLFAVNNYTLTIQVDATPSDVLIASNIAQSAGTSIQQQVKNGIIYTLISTPK